MNAAEFSVSSLTVAGLTAAVILLCVFTHYEVLNFLSRNLRRVSLSPRPRILVLLPSILLTHVLEIWIFAAAYWLALKGEFGKLLGVAGENLYECVSFSAVTYTTLGFGDIVPEGDLRFLVGMEALTGLVLITWSASFTFLEMQRFWKD